eukprot:scaffold90498_cov61-Phaeocystis_antarctica.AAC.2
MAHVSSRRLVSPHLPPFGSCRPRASTRPSCARQAHVALWCGPRVFSRGLVSPTRGLVAGQAGARGPPRLLSEGSSRGARGRPSACGAGDAGAGGGGAGAAAARPRAQGTAHAGRAAGAEGAAARHQP